MKIFTTTVNAVREKTCFRETEIAVRDSQPSPAVQRAQLWTGEVTKHRGGVCWGARPSSCSGAAQSPVDTQPRGMHHGHPQPSPPPPPPFTLVGWHKACCCGAPKQRAHTLLTVKQLLQTRALTTSSDGHPPRTHGATATRAPASDLCVPLRQKRQLMEARHRTAAQIRQQTPPRYLNRPQNSLPQLSAGMCVTSRQEVTREMESCRGGKGSERHRNPLSGLHRFKVLPPGTQNCVKQMQLTLFSCLAVPNKVVFIIWEPG